MLLILSKLDSDVQTREWGTARCPEPGEILLVAQDDGYHPFRCTSLLTTVEADGASSRQVAFCHEQATLSEGAAVAVRHLGLGTMVRVTHVPEPEPSPVEAPPAWTVLPDGLLQLSQPDSDGLVLRFWPPR